jgi:uncharacterized protein (TIGR02466 family)|tara:strand:+ start:123 stop:728 length:606 start_codon:yes stop_codon:yes gene_type:complete
MDHHKVFSTNIFVLDNFLTESVYIGIKKYIELLWKERTPVSKWQSTSDLHTKPAFGPFVNLILDSTKEILKALDYQETHIEITDMWATVLKPGEMHMPHTHSNNFLSGVYYVYSDKAAGITFVDPRAQASVLIPRRKKVSNSNSNLLVYNSNPNRTIIFPSWLQHWVSENKSTNNRISIAWNIQLKGQVGEHLELQSANFG